MSAKKNIPTMAYRRLAKPLLYIRAQAFMATIG